MKKKLNGLKVLTLSRETLRNLEAQELNGIVGGHSLPPTQCTASNNTCDNCPTYSCGLYRCL